MVLNTGLARKSLIIFMTNVFMRWSMTGWKKHLIVRSHCFLLHPRQKYLKAIMDVGFEIWVKMVQLSFVKSSGTSDKVGLQSFLFQRNYELCFNRYFWSNYKLYPYRCLQVFVPYMDKFIEPANMSQKSRLCNAITKVHKMDQKRHMIHI